jgi:hypothetical protein
LLPTAAAETLAASFSTIGLTLGVDQAQKLADFP